MPTPRELAEQITKDLVDKGLLIEAGFQGYRGVCMHPQAGATQVDETRMAFFAGAQHVFASIMGVMEEDAEPTQADMQRMQNIDDELNRFIVAFRKKHNMPEPKRER